MLNFSHPSTIISVIALLLSLTFFFFLFFRTNKDSVTKTLSLVMLANSIWMLFNFLSSQSAFSPSIGVIFWKIDFIAAILVPITILLFVLSLKKQSLSKLLFNVLSIVFLSLSFMILFSSLIISGIDTSVVNFVDYQKGSLFIIYALVIAALTLAAYGYVVRCYFEAEKNTLLHHQLGSVFLAMTFPVVLAVITNLVFPALNISFPRLANLSIIPFVYFMAQSVKKDNILQSISRHLSIRSKIIIGFLTSSVIPIIVIGFLGFNSIKQYLIADTNSTALQEAKNHVDEIDVKLDFLKNELIFLSNIPSIQGVVRAKNNDGFDEITNSSYEQWIVRLESTFFQKILTEDNLMQIRFIDEKGNELVRVDHRDNQALIVPVEKLQNKKDRYYFTDSIKLEESQVYISPLDLNREGAPSEIEIPFKPTLRLATPIFNHNHERQGIVIVNILANTILDSFENDSHPINEFQEVSLVDSSGFYLVNPDEDKRWGGPRDLNTGANISDDYHPGLIDKFLSGNSGTVTDEKNFYAFSIYESGLHSAENNDWFLIYKISKEDLFAPIAQFQNLAIQSGAIFVFLVIIWAIFFSKSLSKPILSLKEGAEIISKGNLNHSVAIDTKDEIGDLSRSFDLMTVAIKQSRAEVDKKVMEQTEEIQKNNQDLEDKQTALLNVLEDVEAEKEKSMALAKELKKFQLAVDGASDHIVITDVEGKVLYANPSSERITGYSVKEMMGKKVGTKELWGGLMSDDFYKKLWQKIGEEKQVFSGEILNQRKNGQKYTALANISPILNDKKEVIFFVGIERDISHEKEVDRMKTEFISLASHQLRTPLSAMKWFLEMLLDGDAGELSKEQREMAENVDQSNQRMIALVNGLLNISRIESGRIVVDPKPTNLIELVGELLKELEPKIKEKGLNIVYDENSKLGEVSVDPTLIQEVYRNLITNAIKYTKNKGKVEISISKDDKNVISQVKDDGLGIPEEDKKKIFEKFHRASNVLKTETDGTGLGLYLSKAIVESSQGKIWFESKENEGSTFWFTLPLSGMVAKEGEVRLGERPVQIKEEVKKEPQSDKNKLALKGSTSKKKRSSKT